MPAKASSCLASTPSGCVRKPACADTPWSEVMVRLVSWLDGGISGESAAVALEM